MEKRRRKRERQKGTKKIERTGRSNNVVNTVGTYVEQTQSDGLRLGCRDMRDRERGKKGNRSWAGEREKGWVTFSTCCFIFLGRVTHRFHSATSLPLTQTQTSMDVFLLWRSIYHNIFPHQVNSSSITWHSSHAADDDEATFLSTITGNGGEWTKILFEIGSREFFDCLETSFRKTRSRCFSASRSVSFFLQLPFHSGIL